MFTFFSFVWRVFFSVFSSFLAWPQKRSYQVVLFLDFLKSLEFFCFHKEVVLNAKLLCRLYYEIVAHFFKYLVQ